MHRLILTAIGILIFHSPSLSQTAASARADTAAHVRGAIARSDSARRMPATIGRSDSTALRPDSLAAVRIDTVARILPMRVIGALEPASRPYPGPDADGIRWNEYRTVTDLLSGIPGVFVRDMGSPGQDNQVTINGAEHTGTAFLVDGVSQNDPFTGTYNFAFFPVEAIERLEVVTGPRSFLFGDNAVGGTVNAITKNFSNNRAYTHIRYSQGVDSYTQTDAMFSQNIFQRFNLSFGLSYLGYGSDRWYQDQNKGRYPNADNEAYAFRTKLRYIVSRNLNLVFSHFFYRTQTGLNGGVNVPATLKGGYNVYDENAATVINLESYEKRFNHHAALSGIYRPTGDSSLSATLTLFGAEQRRELRDEENRSFPTNGIVISDDFQSNILGARGQFDWSLLGNVVTVIGEVKNTRLGNSIYGPDRSRPDRSLMMKDELTIGKYASAAIYERMEHGWNDGTLIGFGADGSLTLPGVATLTAGASLSRRQRPLSELSFSAGGADTLAAMILTASGLGSGSGDIMMLTPEEIHHVYEASISVSPTEQSRAGISATHREIEHWVDRTYILPQWSGAFTVDRVTASLSLRHGNFYLDGDATYSHHSEVLRGGAAIRLYPEWRGQGSLYFRGTLANGNLDLKAGVRGNFFSEFDGMQFSTLDQVLISGGTASIVTRPIGNAGTMGIFVIAHIGDAYIHVLWDNLTNSAYMLSPFYPMYARAVRFGVSWDFQD